MKTNNNNYDNRFDPTKDIMSPVDSMRVSTNIDSVERYRNTDVSTKLLALGITLGFIILNCIFKFI